MSTAAACREKTVMEKPEADTTWIGRSKLFVSTCGPYIAVTSGQLVSWFGSMTCEFVLAVKILQMTNSITLYSMTSLLMVLPGLILSPIAGVVADRFDRRVIMATSDTLSMFSSLSIAIIATFSHLRLRHIYVAALWAAICGEFQYPAASASFDQLVPKQYRDRALGIEQIASGVTQLLAPALAGFLMSFDVPLHWMLWLDVLTWSFGVFPLFLVSFPPVKETKAGKEAKSGGAIQEMMFGFKYLWQHPALLVMTFVFAFDNFVCGYISELMPPLLLTVTTTDILGYTSSFAGSGVLVGGIAVAVLGTPRHAVWVCLLALALQGFTMLSAVFDVRPVLIGSIGFLYFLLDPLIGACVNRVLRAKVENDIQGKVMSVSMCLSTASLPLAYATAGPLAEYVFEPAFSGECSGGSIFCGILKPGSVLPRLIGMGPGRGLCAIFVVLGIMLLSLCIMVLPFSSIRQFDKEVASMEDVDDKEDDKED
ncbi:MFS transporter [Pelomyxa schiedti]|nr:MFS transporter [Pelomyxa schiedti]